MMEEGKAHNGRSIVACGSQNRCIMNSSGLGKIAEALEKRGQSWFVYSKFKSDLKIHVADTCFHVHKLPLICKSGYLSQQVSTHKASHDTEHEVSIDDIPGGAMTFLLVIKFCYGLPLELTSSNIAPLRCAAEFLEMTELICQGNLISKAEVFFTFLILSSWREPFEVLNYCESISSWAEKLNIVNRCAEAIAWKACTAPLAPNKLWVTDVLQLRYDHFVTVMKSLRSRNMKESIIGPCLIRYFNYWVPKAKQNYNEEHRTMLESLIGIMPWKEDSISCEFLLDLLKSSLILGVKESLVEDLVKRVGITLEKCTLDGLIVVSKYDNIKKPRYDLRLMRRIVQHFMMENGFHGSNDPISGSGNLSAVAVARLIDAYLAEVGSDSSVILNEFKWLAEALPENARSCHDRLYTAIDTYLKAHPSLTEQQRKMLCLSMDYHKLSMEAKLHAAKNDRLPLRFTLKVLLFEQLNINSSCLMPKVKSTVLTPRKNRLNNQCTSSQELKTIKSELELMNNDVESLRNYSWLQQESNGIKRSSGWGWHTRRKKTRDTSSITDETSETHVDSLKFPKLHPTLWRWRRNSIS
ncbi:root phototropism protein 3 isoform X1 [Amborella trichopoda]|uniref:root phototropism protein 3 isoform X1 n=1 Tax=Amborella trichopoda TaxID=13333 RepID=UPI0009BFA779|nr:root phototropism protein 3 isoform X1 [Amborella trichopoda]|eukprot:XP_020526823.1 root phototropism protein 3 isoform X1 [Amborella trichopoda]